MNWLQKFVRPKIKNILNKRKTPENLWLSCPQTGELVFHKELEENLYVVPNSGYHFKLPAKKRLEAFFDRGEYNLIQTDDKIYDPLKFRDEKKYFDRVKEARNKTGNNDCITIATGKVEGEQVVTLVQDFSFMGGSLGMSAGNSIIKTFELAIKMNAPVVAFTASGGARMQEGVLSLMQMPRTTIAVQRLHEKKLPYIVVLTNPTTGGVSASYAMLGDIHIAEPGALIGFAGPRVILQTIREELPDNFQKSEYLLEHGMIDAVVERKNIRQTVANIIKILCYKNNSKAIVPLKNKEKKIEHKNSQTNK